jgi:hypothetical protein
MICLQSWSWDYDCDDLSFSFFIIFQLFLVGLVKTFQEIFNELGWLLEIKIEIKDNANERDLRINDDVIRVESHHTFKHPITLKLISDLFEWCYIF